MISKTEQMRLAIIANPGLSAGEIMRRCPDVQSTDGYGVFLKNLTEKGAVSRARIGKKLHYWPPGQAPADECKQDGVAPVRPERAEKPSAQLKEPEGVAAAGPGDVTVKGAQRHARKPKAPIAKPSPIITPDWVLYPIEGGLIVVNKESNAGIRLDVETVCAIAGLVAAA